MNYTVVDGHLILPLTVEEKVEMSEFYYDCYYNTDQDIEDFATEFFYLTHSINVGEIPCRLRFLSDYKEDLAARFPQYKEAIFQNVNDRRFV